MHLELTLTLFPKSILINLNSNLFGAVAIAALGGVANAYPEFKDWLLRTVNDKGKRLFRELLTDNKCLLQLTGKFGGLDYFSLVPNGQATVEEPIPKYYIELNRLVSRLAASRTTLEASTSCDKH